MSIVAIVYLIITILLVLLSAFLSGSETALTALDDMKLRKLDAQHLKGVRRLLKEMTSVLISLLNANSIVNIILALVLENFFKELGYYFNLIESAFIVSGIVIIFGEILPKSLAAVYTLQITPSIIDPVQGVLDLFDSVTNPIMRLSNACVNFLAKHINYSENKQDRRVALYSVVSQGDFLQNSEKLLIARILSLSDRKVTAVMTPRPDMFSVEQTTPLSELKELLLEERHSKIPVYKDQDSNIIGIMHFEDVACLLHNEDMLNCTVQEFMQPFYFIPESKTIESLLEDFRIKSISIAGVVGEYGECMGIITLSDILGELVGEVVDEDFDTNQDIVQILPNCYAVKADVSIPQFNEFFSTNLLSTEEYETMAGYMIEQFQGIPPLFYSIEIDNLSISVRERNMTRVATLLVRVK